MALARDKDDQLKMAIFVDDYFYDFIFSTNWLLCDFRQVANAFVGPVSTRIWVPETIYSFHWLSVINIAPGITV